MDITIPLWLLPVLFLLTILFLEGTKKLFFLSLNAYRALRQPQLPSIIGEPKPLPTADPRLWTEWDWEEAFNYIHSLPPGVVNMVTIKGSDPPRQWRPYHAISTEDQTP